MAVRRACPRLVRSLLVAPVQVAALALASVRLPNAAVRLQARALGPSRTAAGPSAAGRSAAGLTAPGATGPGPTAPGRSAASVWVRTAAALPVALASSTAAGLVVLTIGRAAWYPFWAATADHPRLARSWGGPTPVGATVAHWVVAVAIVAAGALLAEGCRRAYARIVL
jgi:hypothetical protein